MAQPIVWCWLCEGTKGPISTTAAATTAVLLPLLLLLLLLLPLHMCRMMYMYAELTDALKGWGIEAVIETLPETQRGSKQCNTDW
jgi:hypothetical protein